VYPVVNLCSLQSILVRLSIQEREQLIFSIHLVLSVFEKNLVFRPLFKSPSIYLQTFPNSKCMSFFPCYEMLQFMWLKVPTCTAVTLSIIIPLYIGYNRHKGADLINPYNSDIKHFSRNDEYLKKYKENNFRLCVVRMWFLQANATVFVVIYLYMQQIKISPMT
jgi:hypothetical protein